MGVVLVDQGKVCHYFCWPNIVSSSINSLAEKYPVSHWDADQVMFLYMISLKTCLACISAGRFMAGESKSTEKFCVAKFYSDPTNLQKEKAKKPWHQKTFVVGYR